MNATDGPGEAAPLLLGYPLRGSWRAENSPASRVPSHGTSAFALDHALDLVPVDERGRSAPIRPRSLLRSEPPEVFHGFGREVLSPTSGVIETVHDGEADHAAHRGVPSICYALTQGRRVVAGWRAVAGNHVILRARHGDEPVHVVLCHLRRGSIAVRRGQEVTTGEPIARCGNSGNSTEPHLHLQAMTAAEPRSARPVAFTFPGGLPRNGTVVQVQ
ncbi:MAG TPA: M23 family metallopeptidase [Candidatus Brachybacterium intestinipullorum]|uniref:M23 family metallopeptidase n=1 Tax=Candidatus Brachybacterium intestinipullorum TaxID=2838512 RepID=A0A9D2PYH0_9MICO|nr:M23 family metallopeptidase [Candidatus Brachybacterium intestinipullorum]